MIKDNILVIGANGQIGFELTHALREVYGDEHVIAADLTPPNDHLIAHGPYEQLDVRQTIPLAAVVKQHSITQVYHLAAMLSATGEKDPMGAWDLNMRGLFNVLELAKEVGLQKVFWPSSIAVFGPQTPKSHCTQHTVTDPVTAYGISKLAGEQWCHWYHRKYGIDVRSLRYPGLVSYTMPRGGGTTDYAVGMYHGAVKAKRYTCFLKPETRLPMMYMPDAVRATMQLMEAPAEHLTVRTSYNVAGMHFTPQELAESIRDSYKRFVVDYQHDYRQTIAESWPYGINDDQARKDWGWHSNYNLPAMTASMLHHLGKRYPDPIPEN